MARLKGIGADDKRKVAVAAGLGVVVLALAFHTIFGGPEPTPPPPSVPVRPASIAVAPTPRRFTAETPLAPATPVSLDPALHPELMAENEQYLYAGTGRNIFSQESSAPAVASIPKLTAPVRPSAIQAAVNTGPPPPPAIDLRFFGYAARKNGTRSAFLAHGEDVFVAAEGDVVSHRYRVVQITPLSIEIEDLPYHHTQTLQLQN